MCLFAEKDSMTHANGPILGYVLFRRLEPEIVGLDDVSMSSAHCWVVLTSLTVCLSSLWASPLLLFSAQKLA